MTAKRRTIVSVGATFLAGLAALVSCVDGVTPDCSDPAIRCGPLDLDAGSTGDTSVILPEASPGSDAGQDTGASDASGDADADGG